MNVIIGIGGTGAKVVEAAIHLCAAGMGPRNLYAGFVEPDKDNGNLGRTLSLLTAYQNAYDITHMQGACFLDPASTLLRTEILPITDQGAWSPVPDGISNIESLFHAPQMNEATRLLFNSLYTEGRTSPNPMAYEQTMNLDHGFRGRPSVGSAVLTSRAHDGEAFWKALVDLGRLAQVGQSVRIFLVGSIFGGTGASGFPTIARLLRRQLTEDRGLEGRHIEISGALLLPYFSFEQLGADPKEEIAAASDEFLEMTQGALLYYHQKLSREPDIFSNIYVVGCSPLLSISAKPGSGGNRQKNRPLFPELLAGLGAMAFFGGSSNPNNPSKILRMAVEGATPSWPDLPGFTSDNGQIGDARQAIGQLARFCFAFHWAYLPFLKRESYRTYRTQAWFRGLLLRHGVDPNSQPVQDQLITLEKYCVLFLSWIGGVSDGKQSDLLFRSAFAKDGVDEDACALLHEEVGSLEKSQFEELVRNAPALSLFDIYRSLTDQKPSDQAQRLGKFITALYNSCVV